MKRGFLFIDGSNFYHKLKELSGRLDGKRRLLDFDYQRFAQYQGIPVILGTLIKHPDQSFHEKGVDVRLAVEMIRFARQDAYDIAYLLSSDTDLVAANVNLAAAAGGGSQQAASNAGRSGTAGSASKTS